MTSLVTLKDIMLDQVFERKEGEEVETFIMLSDNFDEDEDLTISVKRLNLNFNDAECQMLNITNVTTESRLKK